jgi:hypothetical protein
MRFIQEGECFIDYIESLTETEFLDYLDAIRYLNEIEQMNEIFKVLDSDMERVMRSERMQDILEMRL